MDNFTFFLMTISHIGFGSWYSYFTYISLEKLARTLEAKDISGTLSALIVIETFFFSQAVACLLICCFLLDGKTQSADGYDESHSSTRLVWSIIVTSLGNTI